MRTRTRKPLSTTSRQRLAALRRLRGLWHNRKPDPIKELQKMRREWERSWS